MSVARAWMTNICMVSDSPRPGLRLLRKVPFTKHPKALGITKPLRIKLEDHGTLLPWFKISIKSHATYQRREIQSHVLG